MRQPHHNDHVIHLSSSITPLIPVYPFIHPPSPILLEGIRCTSLHHLLVGRQAVVGQGLVLEEGVVIQDKVRQGNLDEKWEGVAQGLVRLQKCEVQKNEIGWRYRLEI